MLITFAVPAVLGHKSHKRKIDETAQAEYSPPAKKMNAAPAATLVRSPPLQESRNARRKRLRQEKLLAQTEYSGRALSDTRISDHANFENSIPVRTEDSMQQVVASGPPPPQDIPSQLALQHSLDLVTTSLSSVQTSVTPMPLLHSMAMSAPKKIIGMTRESDPSGKHGSFPNFDKNKGPPNPSSSLVMELVPKKFRNRSFVLSWTKQFDPPARVELDAKAGKALIEFSQPQKAIDAFSSPRLPGGDGKEHIRIWWYQPPVRGPEFDEIEEGEIEEDIQGGAGQLRVVDTWNTGTPNYYSGHSLSALDGWSSPHPRGPLPLQSRGIPLEARFEEPLHSPGGHWIATSWSDGSVDWGIESNFDYEYTDYTRSFTPARSVSPRPSDSRYYLDRQRTPQQRFGSRLSTTPGEASGRKRQRKKQTKPHWYSSLKVV